MGLLTRQTREELAKWEADPAGLAFAEFLDDVAEHGLEKACEDRHITQSAVVAWIGANEGRSTAYSGALRVKAELLVHEGLRIVDDEASKVPRAKLRAGFRMQVAGHWSDRYRARVQVDHSGEVRIDAGLTVAMGDLLDRVVSTQNPLPHRAPYVPNGPPAPDADGPGHSSEPLALPEPAGAVEPRMMTIVGPGDLVREVPYVPPEGEWRV